MNKPTPPQLITAEDLRETVANDLVKKDGTPDYVILNIKSRENLAFDINTLIASKLNHKKCKLYRSTPIDVAFKYGEDTHHIYYITQPIEPEKVECEHELKRTKMTRNPQTDGTVILAHCEAANDYCPKCGLELTQE